MKPPHIHIIYYGSHAFSPFYFHLFIKNLVENLWERKKLFTFASVEKGQRTVMEDFVLTIPTQDKAFVETLVQRMGWTIRMRRSSVDNFIKSCPKTPQMTDAE